MNYDPNMVKELILYGENDALLYRQRTVPIQKNLINKIASGKFDLQKSVKLWKYWADDVAKRYTREFPGTRISVDDRKAVAAVMAKDFYEKAQGGEYNYLLHKKYQK